VFVERGGKPPDEIGGGGRGSEEGVPEGLASRTVGERGGKSSKMTGTSGGGLEEDAPGGPDCD
jgi:hypothetical protein